ncbi:hypothetical protein BLAT2472_50473 [Burkholderia latens]
MSKKKVVANLYTATMATRDGAAASPAPASAKNNGNRP